MANWRSKVTKNTPKVALHSIRTLVVGSYKAGKTRLWKELTELHYTNSDEALLLAFESGYKTWELDNIIPLCDEGDGVAMWNSFRDIVKGLVDEAKTSKIVKLIGVDTADRCIDAATAWVLDRAKKKYGKAFSSLQDISDSTSDNGYVLLADELNAQFDALEAAGYGILTLAWTKEKETTLYDGMKYNSVELMMSNTGRKVFESQASFICCLFNQVKVFDKDGNELEKNVTDKKGREKASNFHQTEVVMIFRPNEYVSIAGGRYTNLPEEPIPYSAEAFMKVFEDAVKGQLKKTKKTVEQLEVEQEKETEEKLEEMKKHDDELETKQTIEELQTKIRDTAKGLTKEQLNVAIPKFKELFGGQTADYTKINDVTMLNQALEFLQELK